MGLVVPGVMTVLIGIATRVTESESGGSGGGGDARPVPNR